MTLSFSKCTLVSVLCLVVLVAMTTRSVEARFDTLSPACKLVIRNICSDGIRCDCYKKQDLDCPGREEVGNDEDCEASFENCKDYMNCSY